MSFIFRIGQNWYRNFELPPDQYADENGLLAFGGSYDADCFIRAYMRGIFPWPNGDMDELIPWFTPPERFVIFPSELHLSHSLRRTLKHHPFEIRADQQFAEVIHQCATVSRAEGGTWISPGMEKTFCELHKRGFAHSVECYLDGRLAGGFYGTCIGHIFGGESMFTHVSDASKVAFAVFAKRALDFGIQLIDCQCYTDNMTRYGARHIPREQFLSILETAGQEPLPKSFWEGTWS